MYLILCYVKMKLDKKKIWTTNSEFMGDTWTDTKDRLNQRGLDFNIGVEGKQF